MIYGANTCSPFSPLRSVGGQWETAYTSNHQAIIRGSFGTQSKMQKEDLRRCYRCPPRMTLQGAVTGCTSSAPLKCLLSAVFKTVLKTFLWTATVYPCMWNHLENREGKEITAAKFKSCLLPHLRRIQCNHPANVVDRCRQNLRTQPLSQSRPLCVPEIHNCSFFNGVFRGNWPLCELFSQLTMCGFC